MNVYPFYDGIKSCFNTILEASFQESLDSDQKKHAAVLAQSFLKSNTPIKQLENYLSESGVGAQCAVIEKEYLDRNFSDDYSAYYGRCFRDFSRKCCRIHFFKECYKQQEIEKILVASEKDASLKKFKESYLGFIVIRPLQQTIVGRTCLVPYPCQKSDNNFGRNYPAVCKNEVSFFGIKLNVNCMPFQEQDCGTSACATCALWSTFTVSARMFGNKCPSPSTITTLAMDNNFSIGTRFPNRGLTSEEMIHAIRKNDLEPVIAHLKGCDKSVLAYLFPGFVYAYLNLGVPVIAIIDDMEGWGKHAIAINGYNIKKDSGESLSAMRIDKYYANDDQCCPGARFIPNWDGDTLKIEAYHGPSFAQNLHKTYVLECLMVPLYPKIRVTFSEIAQFVLDCNGILFFADLCCRPCNKNIFKALSSRYKIRSRSGNALKQLAKELRKKYDVYLHKKNIPYKIIQWDITLKASNDIKDEIRRDSKFSKETRVSFLEQHLPRYVWCVRIGYDRQKSAIILIDATDSVQGLCVVGVLFYNGEVQDMARYACANDKNATTNPLVKALCAYDVERNETGKCI